MDPLLLTVSTVALSLVGAGLALALWQKSRRYERELSSLRSQLQERMQATTALGQDLARAEERASLSEKLERRIESLELDLESRRNELSELHAKHKALGAEVDAERRGFEEKVQLLEATKEKLSENFSKISMSALDQSSSQFLRLAQEMLDKKLERSKSELSEKHESFSTTGKEVKSILEKMNVMIQGVEKDRTEQYGDMKRFMQSVFDSTERVGKQAQNLQEALRHSRFQGQWGELQLRNVVESAGMLEHCDFEEQVQSANGKSRPDLVVHLPNDRHVIIDAKAPVSALLDAMEAEDDSVRKQKLQDHTSALREHVKQLAARDYPAQFEGALDFTLLFLPGESFFYAAMENDHALTRFAIDRRIIIVTPMSLIAFLRSAAYGWREAQLTENAREIRTLGKELYDRMQKFNERFNKLGKSLSGAVRDYNSAAGSMERRLLVTTKRLRELGASTEASVKSPELVDGSVQLLEASTEPRETPRQVTLKDGTNS